MKDVLKECEKRDRKEHLKNNLINAFGLICFIIICVSEIKNIAQ